MSIPSSLKENLAKKIAGDIVLSNKPGVTLRKWRDIFYITQSQTAKKLNVSSSVMSDYESGRRTPGTHFIRKFINGVVSLDEECGGRVLRELSYLSDKIAETVIDIKEFQIPVKVKQICQAVDGVPLTCLEQLNRNLYGYTVIDSTKAIQSLSGTDFYQLFGSTTERAVIFINVTSGRSPLVAVRVHPLKPKTVVIQGPKRVDDFAIRLAELEHIPLILSQINTADELITAIKAFYQSYERRRNYQ